MEVAILLSNNVGISISNIKRIPFQRTPQKESGARNSIVWKCLLNNSYSLYTQIAFIRSFMIAARADQFFAWFTSWWLTAPEK